MPPTFKSYFKNLINMKDETLDLIHKVNSKHEKVGTFFILRKFLTKDKAYPKINKNLAIIYPEMCIVTMI